MPRPKGSKNTTVILDQIEVEQEPVTLPKRATNREGSRAHEVFTEPVQRSYDQGIGLALRVPNDQVKPTLSLIRRAASRLGLGVRIVVEEGVDTSGRKRVLFQGKTKRKYTPKDAVRDDEQPNPPVEQ